MMKIEQWRKFFGARVCRKWQNRIAEIGLHIGPVKHPKDVLDQLIISMNEKIDSDFIPISHTVDLEFHPAGGYTTVVDDEDIDEKRGMYNLFSELTGTIRGRDSRGEFEIKLFSRFISHPFWQYVAK